MEQNKITTLFFGNKSACLCKAEFPPQFPGEGLIKVTEYPKRNIFGKKNTDIPAKGNITNPYYIDLPIITVRGEKTKEVLRLMCEDIHGKPNFELAGYLGLLEKEKTVNALSIQLDVTTRLLKDLSTKVGILNIDELIKKETLRELDHAKNIKNRLGLSFDILPFMKGMKK